jgi:hypothetical protein
MKGCPTIPYVEEAPPATSGGMLSGNHNFPNFINFISNPLQNIDPRAVTAIYPLFLGSWVSGPPALPDGNIQVYGPASTVALSERLADRPRGVCPAAAQARFQLLDVLRRQLRPVDR